MQEILHVFLTFSDKVHLFPAKYRIYHFDGMVLSFFSLLNIIVRFSALKFMTRNKNSKISGGIHNLLKYIVLIWCENCGVFRVPKF